MIREDFRNYLLTSGSRSVKRCGPEIVIFDRRPLAEATTRNAAAALPRLASLIGLSADHPRPA